MSLVIDAHQHFWQLSQPFDYTWLENPDLATIRRDYLPEDLQPLLQQAGVDYSVFVQTQHNVAENRWVLELAEQNEFLIGVVGWVDLASEACEDQLLEFKDHPLFCGVRHVTQDEPDEDFIVHPDVLRGLKVLEKHNIPFDLLFYVQHLKHATTLAQELPDLPMVIDHLSKPKIAEQSFDGWSGDLRAAARYPNIYCKLSGMVTEADWTNWKVDDLQPYVEIAIDAFGPERCMFGSDWPVCELAATYGEVSTTLNELIASLSPSERSNILGETARKFYRFSI